MLDWLRRRICRCPEPEPMIQVTGRSTTGGMIVTPYGATEFAPWVPPDEEFAPIGRPERHLRLVRDETAEQ